MRTINVHLTVALSRLLKENAGTECRFFSRQAAVYLEILASAAQQEQRLYRNLLLRWRLPDSLKRPNSDGIDIDAETYDYLFDWAGSMGLTMSAFVRLALHNMAQWDGKLTGCRPVEKEEFIDRLLKAIGSNRKPTIQ